MPLLAAIALVVGDLAVIGAALGWGWRRLDSVRQMAADWQGAPERRDPTGTVIDPARPGVQGRLVRLEVAQAENASQLAAINKELHPNSGTSFHDRALGEIAELKAAVAELQREHHTDTSTLEAA